MANKDGIITTPIQVTDVQTVTGETASDLIALCKSAKINIWSRYKPVRNTSATALMTDDDNYKVSVLTPCGFNIRRSRNFNIVFNNQTWRYLRPDGRNYPYRLGDFNLYYQDAKCPILGVKCSTKVAKGGNIRVSLVPNLSAQGKGAGSITFTEMPILIDGVMKTFNDLYFGIVLYKGSATSYTDYQMYTTAENKGVFEEITIKMPDGVEVGGTWKVVPFFATAKSVYPQLTTSTMPDIIPIPNTSAQIVKVASKTELAYIAVTAFWSEQTGSTADLEVSVTLVNNSTESVFFSQVTVLIFQGQSENPYRQQVIITTPGLTLEANKSKTYNLTFANLVVGEHYVQVVAIPLQYSTDKQAVFLSNNTELIDE